MSSELKRPTLFVALGVILSLAGCAKGDLDSASPFDQPPKQAVALQEAKLQFHEGNYGKAAESYQTIVEKDSLNAEAWLGLAASYDEIRRFDLADKAYEQVVSLVGETPPVLNNIGYSYYLRGDLKTARKKLETAYHLAPGSRHVINNIELLNKKLASMGEEPIIY